jgi:cytoskeletal protein CcmA (bactofilin family)
VFKKTEDTEWSRFSRALSGQSRAGTEQEQEQDGVILKEEPQDTAPLPREAAAREAPAREPAARESAVRELPQREVAPSIPTPAPAPIKPSPAVQPGYLSRVHTPIAPQETDEAETVIGVQSTFDGNLRCESSLRIRGTAQGEITCAKSVFVEESAKVNANVKASNAVVAGEVEGSITCDGRLEILATGRVTGELTAGVLIIQEGAFFEGHLKMKDRG